MGFSLQLDGFEDLGAAFAVAPQLVREEALRAVTEADLLLKREIKDAMPTATRVSRASVFSRETALPEGALGVVGSAQPHLVYVELGSKPHFPPIEALQDWVRVKFGYTSAKEIRQTAFLIGRAIARRGTKPVGMFGNTYARLEPTLIGIFSRARDRIITRLTSR